MKGKLFINGRWSVSERSFTTINPNTGREFGQVSLASKEEVDLAVTAATAALGPWKVTCVEDRAEIMNRFSALLQERYGEAGKPTELKLLISDEVGKRLPEADIEVIESSDMVSYLAGRAVSVLQDLRPELDRTLWPSKISRVYYEPIGVVAVIKPWNYPLELPLWAIVPALMGGNPVVFKPSEYSSFVGLEIARLFEEAGLPSGVLNVVTGDDSVGRMLVKHPDVRMVSFTGGMKAGSEIASTCARTWKKFSLELGGNDAAIVTSDANLELAANGLSWGAFCNSGQVCVGVKRAYVHRKIFAGLVERLTAIVRSLRPGTDFGPMISDRQMRHVQDLVDDAVANGARILAASGISSTSKGFYFPPTLIVDVDSSMRIMNEECFGPVLPIVPIASVEEAIKLANDSDFGLGASVWTADPSAGERIAREIESGMVWVNDVNVAFAQAPWAGRKRSGMGVELSDHGIFEYVQPKHISVETSPSVRRDWWFPYAEAHAEGGNETDVV